MMSLEAYERDTGLRTATICTGCGNPMCYAFATSVDGSRVAVAVEAECCVGKFSITLNHDQVAKIQRNRAKIKFGHQGQWEVS